MMAQRNEIIFTQTDVLFDLVLNAVNELHQAQRLRITNFQEAYLDQVQSNNDDPDLTDCFGAKPGTASIQRRTAFSKTMACVLRHLMLNATGIPENAWPEHHKSNKLQLRRNHKNMRTNFNSLSPNHFKLTEDATAAQHYYGSYDHQFPHYHLKNILAGVKIGNIAQIKGEMIIFRFDANVRLTDIIDIITTGGAVEDPNDDWRMSKTYARVICIVRKVLAGDDGEWMKTLNTILPKQTVVAEAKKSMLETYGRLIPENPEQPCDIGKLYEEFQGLKVTKDINT